MDRCSGTSLTNRPSDEGSRLFCKSTTIWRRRQQLPKATTSIPLCNSQIPLCSVLDQSVVSQYPFPYTKRVYLYEILNLQTAKKHFAMATIKIGHQSPLNR